MDFTTSSVPMAGLLPELWAMIFSHLAGDYRTLCSLSLTSKAWRSTSLPALLEVVDLSSHNAGRQQSHETPWRGPVYADFHARYRPVELRLLSRQRAFLRLLTRRPELARHVRTLVWTFVWIDLEEFELTAIDCETWNVFARMPGITHLDLASLHAVWNDDYVRQSPPVLFPALKYLRLLGWMHRGLVKAVLASPNARKLRKIDLDYLEDEGALPDGKPIGRSIVYDHARHMERTCKIDCVSAELLARQDTGQAFIFPGPNWFSLHLLLAQQLPFLTHLRVKVAHFNHHTDLRNYATMFKNAADLLVKTRNTLQILEITFNVPYEATGAPGFQAAMQDMLGTYQITSIRMTTLFVGNLLVSFRAEAFPCLKRVKLNGFYYREMDAATVQFQAEAAKLADAVQTLRDYLPGGVELIEVPSESRRKSFVGYEIVGQGVGEYRHLLEGS